MGIRRIPRADNFVTVPQTAGEIDFAYVTLDLAAASGLSPLPIRLANGRQFAKGGYGVSHILCVHGAALAQAEYFSVQDFVDDVVAPLMRSTPGVMAGSFSCCASRWMVHATG